MRPLLWILLVLGSLSPLSGLGRLVLADGTSVALGTNEVPGGLTLVFSPQTLRPGAWLTLPRGTFLEEATFEGGGTKTILEVPKVQAPSIRYGLQVPGRTYTLTLRGRLPQNPVVLLTDRRPGAPGVTWVTRSAADLTVALAPWKVPPGFVPLLTLTRTGGHPVKVTVSSGENSRTFRLPSEVPRWDFSPEAWGFPPSEVKLTGDAPQLTTVEIRALPPRAAVPADPATLLAWPRTAWREPRREWFSWTGTSVLVLVTDSYRTQDEYLKRLAFYVEKTGFRGTLVSDEQVAQSHAWNAHDYAAPDLARFFTQAARERFPLHPEEVELRERLVASGILKPTATGWDPGAGALVGISDESAPSLRAVLFTHEGFHGLYFTSSEFREGVRQAWMGLSDGAREAFRTFLAASQYDPSDEALMVNEFQAYVLQRRSTEWENFFRTRVLSTARPTGRSQTWLAEYLAAAQTLDILVNSLYGLRSGTVSLVNPL